VAAIAAATATVAAAAAVAQETMQMHILLKRETAATRTKLLPKQTI